MVFLQMAHFFPILLFVNMIEKGFFFRSLSQMKLNSSIRMLEVLYILIFGNEITNNLICIFAGVAACITE